jgi:MATE family multidrug resistance protein
MEFESAKMFMIAHKVTYPFTFIHFITLGTHWFFSWFLISELEWGIAGAGWAIILTELLNILGLLGIMISYSSICSIH